MKEKQERVDLDLTDFLEYKQQKINLTEGLLGQASDNDDMYNFKAPKKEDKIISNDLQFLNI